MYLVAKTETFAKLFFVVSFTGLFAYIVLAFYTFHTAYTTVTDLKKVQAKIQRHPAVSSSDDRFDNDLKYILLWTTSSEIIANGVGEGQLPFITNNCSHINCFWTTNKQLLNGDYTNFDAVVLELPIVKLWRKLQLPQFRSHKQKYVYRGMLSSEDQVICNSEVDNYFNWTWSYKLYSDICNPFFEVRDTKGKVVAPSIDVEWPAYSKTLTLPSSEIDKLKTKTKAVAWVMKKCQTRFNRLEFVKEFYFAMKELKLKFDVYGCGHLQCPPEGCMKAIRRDYYFYLVYEDSIAEDYLTEEVLTAYENYAVPIVISGAELSKFLPVGSYIDGHTTHVDEIAEIIHYNIHNIKVYHRFYLWKIYFTIQKVDNLSGICDLCKNLNNPNMVRTLSVYETFRKWWYPGSLAERCSPKSAVQYAEVLSYLNSSIKHPFRKIVSMNSRN